MSQKTRAQLSSEVDTQFATNTTGAITAAKLRSVVKNILDSVFTPLTDGVAVLTGDSRLRRRPLTESEILHPCGEAIDSTWTETASSFAGGTVIAAADIPGQVYASYVSGSPALSSGGPAIVNQAGYKAAFELEFDLTSSAFEVSITNRTAVNYCVLVNGAVVGTGNCKDGVSSGTHGYQKISFLSWDTRRITIISDCAINGIAVPVGAVVSRPTRKTRKRCVVVGDSITEAWQTEIGRMTGGFAHRLRHLFGWEVIPSGSGGTGYLKTNGSRVKLRDRLAADCYAYSPDIVIVQMGINDDVSTEASRIAVANEADLCIQDIKTNLPNATVVVLSPFYPATPTAEYTDLGSRISAKAAARGVYYVNVLGWFTDANHDTYFTIDGDETHPGLLGHSYFASRLAEELFNLGLYKDAWLASLGPLKRHAFKDVTARSISSNNDFPLRVGQDGRGDLFLGHGTFFGPSAGTELYPRDGVGDPVLLYVSKDGELSVYTAGSDILLFSKTGGFKKLLTTEAGRKVHLRAVSADFTIDSDSLAFDEFVSGAGTITITLPAASSKYSRRIAIVNTGTGVVTVNATGAGQITGIQTSDGPLAANTLALAKWEAVTLISNGTTWQIFSSNTKLANVAYTGDYWNLANKPKLDELDAPLARTDLDATTGLHGLMSSADKAKLDGIEAQADKTDAGNVGDAISGTVQAGTYDESDSIAVLIGGLLRKLPFAVLNSTLKAYNDALYAAASHTHTAATTGAAGFMSAADKSKLDGIAANANNYSLPTAAASTLGGVKVGTGLAIDGSGVLSVSGTSGGGTKTYAVFRALDNQPPASAYATVDTRNSIAVLDFDDGATNEGAVFVGVMPESASLGSGLLVRIHWAATTATSGACRWGAQFERMNTDMDSDSFDTATEAHTTTSGTSGIPNVTEITCTAIDGITAGDPYRVKIYRDSSDTTNDTMSGDAELIVVEIRSAA